MHGASIIILSTLDKICIIMFFASCAKNNVHLEEHAHSFTCFDLRSNGQLGQKGDLKMMAWKAIQHL